MTDAGTVRDWESIALIDRLYWRDIVAFNSLVAACRRRGMTLIQRVRQRIDELKHQTTGYYQDYVCERMTNNGSL